MVVVVQERQEVESQNSATPSDDGTGVRPPRVGSPTELPYRDLSSNEFERLCQDVAKVQGFTNVDRYGKPGQAQDGVDFLGISSQGSPMAFQAKQVAEITASELRDIVRRFADGPLAARTDAFVICMSVEANERNFQDKLAELRQQHPFAIKVWDAVHLTHLLHDKEQLVHKYFGPHWGEAFFGRATSPRQRLDAEALLLGPVEALGLAPKVEEAERLARTSPGDAVRLYGEIADDLRERFPGHADRFQQLRATALKEAGDPAKSHDLLMALAIRDLFERAEPQLSFGVARGLEELQDEVDQARRTRGATLILFGRWHENPAELERMAWCFDSLEPEDPYAPFIAALLTEAALAERAFQLVLNREVSLRKAVDHGDEQIALRVRAALADAGVPGAWPGLISEAESFRLPAAEGTYVRLRAARWCAWNGELDRALSLYRQAMKLGAEADLDLDVENALWSLTALYRFPDQFEELARTNQLALSIDGTRSFLKPNPRTRQHSYQYLANGRMPDAHLWTRYWLLESIRSGCLMDELESHAILARIYGQSGYPLQSLEHAVLSGQGALVKEAAPKVGAWPEFLANAVGSTAPWVRPTALSALEHVGDLAPPEVARVLVSEVLHRLGDGPDDM